MKIQYAKKKAYWQEKIFWSCLNNILVYDDKLFNAIKNYIDHSSFESWRSLLTTMVILLENEMILVWWACSKSRKLLLLVKNMHMELLLILWINIVVWEKALWCSIFEMVCKGCEGGFGKMLHAIIHDY